MGLWSRDSDADRVRGINFQRLSTSGENCNTSSNCPEMRMPIDGPWYIGIQHKVNKLLSKISLETTWTRIFHGMRGQDRNGLQGLEVTL
ncbi:hypothetical protein MAR_005793 [Mya arenaria]|uniref:Uncharacterized protein n=1 Tax=Mya arenaria TaxID=6604 RepID=A0ABY7F0H8_MYAAR|nr:hypothetical protein MAR_005793 [Mya arenaria]